MSYISSESESTNGSSNSDSSRRIEGPDDPDSIFPIELSNFSKIEKGEDISDALWRSKLQVTK
jgi:hypothetical protein